MGRQVVDLHPEAIADGREAGEWYRARSVQAAELFRRELEDAIGRIREAPETWPRYLHGTRRYVLRVFPYCVIYTTDGQNSIVIAIAHSKRRADYWKTRAK
jgi:toxin ParE1/3/4